MSTHELDEERIFHLAREIPGQSARSEYFDQVCAGDQALRERVEELLRAHEQEQSFLKSHAQQVAATVDLSPGTERPGATIGRYKLMEQIGEGGMGTVFVAQQERPIRRKVALKVIKPGMDTKSVVARFEAERQALAMMDHPNIAKVLDAGTTESGRPYFAMELVKGVPITDYCDRNRLSIKERLELFIQVCHAIQHAHQKGIIHRDIKSSNVLVTLHDGKPVPKVIDFGVAKALNARLTDKTIYTEHLQVVGTLLYMSPEQAELSGLDVDTRSDIYSLAVLLYELLTGTTPFQKNELDKAGFDEQRRIIRDKEPPRASVRISSLGETATAVAENRKTDHKKLHRAVKGDLDWIVLKAMEKDRTRRYDTASSLADDIGAFLNNEPVKARAPSWDYLATKFIKRNRSAVAAGVVIASTIATAIGGVLWQAGIARMEAQNAKEAKGELDGTVQKLNATIEEHHALIIERSLLHAVNGELDELDVTIELARRAKVSEDWLLTLEGLGLLHVGKNELARTIFEKALQVNSDNVSAQSLLSWAYFHTGQTDQWSHHVEFLKTAEPRERWHDFDTYFLGYAHFYMDYAKAIEYFDEVVTKHPAWLFARAMRAVSESHQSWQFKDRDLAWKGLRQLQSIEELLPETPFVWLLEIFAHSSVIYCDPDSPETKAIIPAATTAARKLEEHKEYAVGAVCRAKFFELINDGHGLTQARNDLLNFGGGFLFLPAFEYLFATGRDKEILVLKNRGVEVELMQAMVYAWNGDKAEAKSICQRLTPGHKSWIVRQRILWVYLLCQEREEAITVATKWIDESDAQTVQRSMTRDRDAVEFISLGFNPTSLNLDDPSDQIRIRARFILGLQALSMQDTTKAIDLFGESLAEGDDWEVTRYAKAFHDRLVLEKGKTVGVEEKPLAIDN